MINDDADGVAKGNSAMRPARTTIFIAAAGMLIVATGCGGASDTPPPPTPPASSGITPSPAETASIPARVLHVLRPGGTLHIGTVSYTLTRHEHRETNGGAEDGFYIVATAPERVRFTYYGHFGITTEPQPERTQIPVEESLTGFEPLYRPIEGRKTEGWIVFDTRNQSKITQLTYRNQWFAEDAYWDLAAEPTGDFQHG